jgi:uncharacterized damage-inducible protein DinB
MSLPEVWLRGPLPNVPGLLQPVAHALLQSGEEVQKILDEFPDEKLWIKPAGVASVGFHLQHLKDVLDRLFTYAKGQQLTQEQLLQLKAEGEPSESSGEELVRAFRMQITKSIAQLEQTDPSTLLNPVGVGRKQLPSTVLGLLFHAAEHTQRHTGQLLVTVRVLLSDDFKTTL